MEGNIMKSVYGFLMALLTFWPFLSVAQSETNTPTDITINRNGVLLKGKFHSAEGVGLLPTVLLLQGFPGNETDVLGIGKVLSQSGINMITFNYSGTFKSQGESSMGNSIKDIIAAYDFLRNPENINKFQIDTSYIILGGYSYGGGMAMTYAIKHPDIKSVFTIAGVDWGEYYEEYIRNPEFKKTVDTNLEKMAGQAEIVRLASGALPKEIAEAGIDKLDPAYFLRKSAISLIDNDILIICGWDDPQATVDRYILPFYRTLKKEKAEKVEIIAFQDGHSFSKSRQELATAIKKWVLSVPERRK
jgi:dipeptidyl aminopeptidase/acylaminoacyl peptidase